MTSDSQGLTSAGLRQCKRGETLLMCPNVKEFKTWFFSIVRADIYGGREAQRGCAASSRPPMASIASESCYLCHPQ